MDNGDDAGLNKARALRTAVQWPLEEICETTYAQYDIAWSLRVPIDLSCP